MERKDNIQDANGPKQPRQRVRITTARPTAYGERPQRPYGERPQYGRPQRPQYVLQCTERILCAKNAEFDYMEAHGGSAVSYAWWVWRKGWSGQTTLDWINHPTAQQAVQLELF